MGIASSKYEALNKAADKFEGQMLIELSNSNYVSYEQVLDAFDTALRSSGIRSDIRMMILANFSRAEYDKVFFLHNSMSRTVADAHRLAMMMANYTRLLGRSVIDNAGLKR